MKADYDKLMSLAGQPPQAGPVGGGQKKDVTDVVRPDAAPARPDLDDEEADVGLRIAAGSLRRATDRKKFLESVYGAGNVLDTPDPENWQVRRPDGKTIWYNRPHSFFDPSTWSLSSLGKDMASAIPELGEAVGAGIGTALAAPSLVGAAAGSAAGGALGQQVGRYGADALSFLLGYNPGKFDARSRSDKISALQGDIALNALGGAGGHVIGKGLGFAGRKAAEYFSPFDTAPALTDSGVYRTGVEKTGDLLAALGIDQDSAGSIWALSPQGASTIARANQMAFLGGGLEAARGALAQGNRAVEDIVSAGGRFDPRASLGRLTNDLVQVVENKAQGHLNRGADNYADALAAGERLPVGNVLAGENTNLAHVSALDDFLDKAGRGDWAGILPQEYAGVQPDLVDAGAAGVNLLRGFSTRRPEFLRSDLQAAHGSALRSAAVLERAVATEQGKMARTQDALARAQANLDRATSPDVIRTRQARVRMLESRLDSHQSDIDDLLRQAAERTGLAENITGYRTVPQVLRRTAALNDLSVELGPTGAVKRESGKALRALLEGPQYGPEMNNVRALLDASRNSYEDFGTLAHDLSPLGRLKALSSQETTELGRALTGTSVGGRTAAFSPSSGFTAAEPFEALSAVASRGVEPSLDRVIREIIGVRAATAIRSKMGDMTLANLHKAGATSDLVDALRNTLPAIYGDAASGRMTNALSVGKDEQLGHLIKSLQEAAKTRAESGATLGAVQSKPSLLFTLAPRPAWAVQSVRPGNRLVSLLAGSDYGTFAGQLQRGRRRSQDAAIRDLADRVAGGQASKLTDSQMLSALAPYGGGDLNRYRRAFGPFRMSAGYTTPEAELIEAVFGGAGKSAVQRARSLAERLGTVAGSRDMEYEYRRSR